MVFNLTDIPIICTDSYSHLVLSEIDDYFFNHVIYALQPLTYSFHKNNVNKRMLSPIPLTELTKVLDSRLQPSGFCIKKRNSRLLIVVLIVIVIIIIHHNYNNL